MVKQAPKKKITINCNTLHSYRECRKVQFDHFYLSCDQLVSDAMHSTKSSLAGLVLGDPS